MRNDEGKRVAWGAGLKRKNVSGVRCSQGGKEGEMAPGEWTGEMGKAGVCTMSFESGQR